MTTLTRGASGASRGSRRPRVPANAASASAGASAMRAKYRLHRGPHQVAVDTIVQRAAIDAESPVGRFNGLVDIIIGVGEAHDERRRDHAAANEFLQKERAKSL